MENDDICMDVLSRLPVKNLLHLKLVCKRWEGLISDKSFSQSMLQRREPISGFFFQERFQWCDEDIKTTSYIPVGTGGGEEGINVQKSVLSFLPEDVVISGSSNGLVCCRGVIASRAPGPYPSIFICNPCNKQWIRLEGTTLDRKNSLGLAFDPSHIFMDITNFKVVKITQARAGMEVARYSFEIYSHQVGAWRKSQEICQCNHNLYKNKGVLVGGILHWLTDGDRVVMFDVENELSRLISAPFPTLHLIAIPEMCIGEYKGRLHYARISEDGLQVWALLDYYDSAWSLVHSAALELMEEENPSILFNLREKVLRRMTIESTPCINPLAFKDGLLLMRVSTRIISYCIETRKMKTLCDLLALGPNSIFGPSVIPHSMTLAPLTLKSSFLF